MEGSIFQVKSVACLPNTSYSVENMETESADALLAKLEAATPVAEAPEPAATEVVTEPVATVETETPTEETVPTETPTEEKPAEETPPPSDDEAQGRYRLKGKLAAVAQLVKEGGMTEQEAIDRVYGQAKADSAATATEAPALEPDPIAVLEAEQAEITARLERAAEEESVYTPALRKDQKRELEITLEIREAKAAKAAAEAQQAKAAEAEVDAKWDADVAQVQTLYGDTAKDDGPLGKAILDEYDLAAKDASHPFHALWNSANLSPLVMAPYVAAKLGIAPASKATPAPAATPETRRLPIPGGARTTPAPTTSAATQAAAQRERVTKAGGDANALANIFEEANGGSREIGIRMA